MADPILECDCTPTVYDDGSESHEYGCAIYPGCPHEFPDLICDMPCPCLCGSCARLSVAHEARRRRG